MMAGPRPVTPERIGLIAELETILEGKGYGGCRVRLLKGDAEAVVIQVRGKDLPRVAASSGPGGIPDLFSEFGIKKVLLDLKGR